MNTTTTLNRTLITMAILATLTLVGCNKALPTEPESNFDTDVTYAQNDAPDTFASERVRPTRGTPDGSIDAMASSLNSTGEATRTSSRRRPTRPGTSTSQPPASGDPTTTGTTDPVPPTTPTPPVSYDCKGPCDGILRIPAYGDYMAAIYAARDRVRAAVNSGELKATKKVRNWNMVPNVEWKACFFWVENGFYYDADGNKVVGACAAGMTDLVNNKIVIATKDESRTLALVKWEATNWYLYQIGRTDLLDRWQ